MRLRTFAGILLLGCLAGPPEPGEEGGECRLGTPPCDPGLVCKSGCVAADEPDPDAIPGLDVVWTLAKRSLDADGEDSVGVTVRVYVRETAEPYTGDVRISVNPELAGEVQPPRVTLDASGEGRAVFTACSAGSFGCTASAVLLLGPIEEPLRDDSASPQITLVGGGEVGGGGGGGGGGGSRPVSGRRPAGADDCTTPGALVKVTQGGRTLFEGSLGEGTILENCHPAGCGVTYTAGDAGARVTVLHARSNDVHQDRLFGCEPPDLHQGGFPVPQQAGLSVTVPGGGLFACTASDAMGAGGTGSGQIYEEVQCANTNWNGFLAAFNVTCPGADDEKPVKIIGCLRYGY